MNFFNKLLVVSRDFCLLAAEVKSTETVGPVLIHIITEKGHGYEPAVTASDKMHGVAKYDIATGKQNKPKAKVCAPCLHRSLFCMPV